jgi:ElaA protein
MNVTMRWHSFAELTGSEVYDILSLRQRVFIVEQRCAYADADGTDRISFHLCGRTPAGELAAYLRLIPPGGRYPVPALGRVTTAPEIRGAGIGRLLVEEGIRRSSSAFPDSPITLSAQLHLEGFYSSFGFLPEGIPHDEDGILHIMMVRPPPVR